MYFVDRRTAFFHFCILNPGSSFIKPKILLLKLSRVSSLNSGTRSAISRGCANTCCWHVTERRISVSKRHDGRTVRRTHAATSPTSQQCKLVYLQATSNKAYWPKLLTFMSVVLGVKRSVYSGGTVERIGKTVRSLKSHNWPAREVCCSQIRGRKSGVA
jgi:hypothetical protein